MKQFFAQSEYSMWDSDNYKLSRQVKSNTACQQGLCKYEILGLEGKFFSVLST